MRRYTNSCSMMQVAVEAEPAALRRANDAVMSVILLRPYASLHLFSVHRLANLGCVCLQDGSAAPGVAVMRCEECEDQT
jgi:hypothetical protein